MLRVGQERNGRSRTVVTVIVGSASVTSERARAPSVGSASRSEDISYDPSYSSRAQFALGMQPYVEIAENL